MEELFVSTPNKSKTSSLKCGQYIHSFFNNQFVGYYVCPRRTNCTPALLHWHLASLTRKLVEKWPDIWNSVFGFSSVTAHLLILLCTCVNFWLKIKQLFSHTLPTHQLSHGTCSSSWTSRWCYREGVLMSSWGMGNHHGMHFPCIKPCTSWNASNGNAIAGLAVGVPCRLLWTGQHWLGCQCWCGEVNSACKLSDWTMYSPTASLEKNMACRAQWSDLVVFSYSWSFPDLHLNTM